MKSKKTPTPLASTDVVSTQLQAARERLETVGVKYRQLLLAYQAVTRDLVELGVTIPYRVLQGGDPKSSDFALGLMAMNGAGPLDAVGSCHWVAHKLLGGERFCDDAESDIHF